MSNNDDEAEKIKSLLNIFTPEELNSIFEDTYKSIQEKINKCPKCKTCGGFAKWKTEGKYYDYCYGETCENLGSNNGVRKRGPKVNMETKRKFIIVCGLFGGTYVESVTKENDNISLC